MVMKEDFDCDYTMNSRYIHAKSHLPLTLRYRGSLPPTSASASGHGDGVQWLGVEYDDPTKGKGHSGTYLSTQIFQTVQPGAGAFLKYIPGSKPLLTGISLIQAIEERYAPLVLPDNVEKNNIGSSSSNVVDDVVTLGSSNEAIVVEAPNMAGVKRRIRQLERLREIGLDGEWVTHLGGNEQLRGIFRERLKGVRTLDLSRNLVTSWADMAEIAAHLTGLRTLVLNRSRIHPPTDLTSDQKMACLKAFSGVVELHLGDAALTWPQALDVARMFPSLEVLYLNDNPLIRALSLDNGTVSFLPLLKRISLHGCGLDSWSDIAAGLSLIPSLESVNLSALPFRTIPDCPAGTRRLDLVHLALTESRVSTWSDIDHLDSWTGGKLQQLQFSRIDMVDSADSLGQPSEAPARIPKGPSGPERIGESPGGPELISGDPRVDRAIVIAKLGALDMLNSSPVTASERCDAELYYIQYATKSLSSNPGFKWGRYDELVRFHGVSLSQAAPARTSALKSKMIKLVIHPPGGDPFDMRLLPASPVSLLKKRIARQLSVSESEVRVWTIRGKMENTSGDAPTRGEELDEGREVGWWLTDGDDVVVDVDGIV